MRMRLRPVPRTGAHIVNMLSSLHIRKCGDAAHAEELPKVPRGRKRRGDDRPPNASICALRISALRPTVVHYRN
jgi:hypothetical protein